MNLTAHEIFQGILLLVGGGIGGAFLKFLIDSRKQQGEEQKTWWAEAEKIRQELREEKEGLRSEIKELRDEIRTLTAEKKALEDRVEALEEERDGAHDLLNECIRERDEARRERDELKLLQEENEWLQDVVNSFLILQDMRETGREPVEGAGKRAERILSDYLKKMNEPAGTTTEVRSRGRNPEASNG